MEQFQGGSSGENGRQNKCDSVEVKFMFAIVL